MINSAVLVIDMLRDFVYGSLRSNPKTGLHKVKINESFLKAENLNKDFITAYSSAVRIYMKQITFEKMHESLKQQKHIVKVPLEIASQIAETLYKISHL